MSDASLKGKLQIVLDSGQVIDLGPVDIPFNISVGAKPSKPGPVYRKGDEIGRAGGNATGPVFNIDAETSSLSMEDHVKALDRQRDRLRR